MGAYTSKQTCLVIVLDLQVFHGLVQVLELLHQEVSLKLKLLLGDRHGPNFLFLLNQLVSGCVQLSFSLINLSHVGTCFEFIFLC